MPSSSVRYLTVRARAASSPTARVRSSSSEDWASGTTLRQRRPSLSTSSSTAGHVSVESPLCLTVIMPASSLTLSEPYMTLRVAALISASVSCALSTREVCGDAMRSPFMSLMSSESLSSVST